MTLLTFESWIDQCADVPCMFGLSHGVHNVCAEFA